MRWGWGEEDNVRTVSVMLRGIIFQTFYSFRPDTYGAESRLNVDKKISLRIEIFLFCSVLDTQFSFANADFYINSFLIFTKRKKSGHAQQRRKHHACTPRQSSRTTTYVYCGLKLNILISKVDTRNYE